MIWFCGWETFIILSYREAFLLPRFLQKKYLSNLGINEHLAFPKIIY